MNSELATLTKSRVSPAPARPSEVNQSSGASGSTELERKKIERESLSRRYTSEHPDVRKLEAEIAVLEKRISKSEAPPTSRTVASSLPQTQEDDSDDVLA